MRGYEGMNEQIIQQQLSKDFYGKGFFFKNAHFGGFECDFLHISKADITHEIEIKCSKQDFKRDFTHKHCGVQRELIKEYNLPTINNYREVQKHVILASKCPIGPQRYSFCFPEGLINHDDVPEAYGIYEVKERGEPGSIIIKKVRAPKLRHKNKIKDKTISRLLVNYWHNRVYKETYPEYIQSLKDDKKREDDYNRGRYKKINDALFNSEYKLGECQECSKPIMVKQFPDDPEYCTRCKRYT